MDSLQLPQDQLKAALDYLENRGFVSCLGESRVYMIENLKLCSAVECGVSLVGFIDYLLNEAPRLGSKYRKKSLPGEDYITCGSVRTNRPLAVNKAVKRYWVGYINSVPDFPSNFRELHTNIVAFFNNIGIIDRSKNYAIISCSELRMIRRVAKVVDMCGMVFCPDGDAVVYSRPSYEPIDIACIVQEVLWFKSKLMGEALYRLEMRYGADTVFIKAYCRIHDLICLGGNFGVRVLQDPLETVCSLTDENREALSNLCSRHMTPAMSYVSGTECKSELNR